MTNVVPAVPDPAAIEAEIQRAEEFLTGLEDHTLNVLTITSPTPEDAPFLGRNISKLSPIVSNLIESQVVRSVADELDLTGNFDWIRQDPGWPDAGLRLDGTIVGGFEVKAWYVLATEVTARFHAAQSAIEGLYAKVILVPWVMDRIVYGQPRILGHLNIDALELAKQRDAYYHRPPERIVVEPLDQGERAKNLRQTNVIGQKLQEINPAEKARAQMFVEKFKAPPIPHDQETRALNGFLISNFPYREESNFGKVGRTFYEPVKNYESKMLAKQIHGRTMADWRTVISQLNSSNNRVRAAAEKVVEALYAKED